MPGLSSSSLSPVAAISPIRGASKAVTIHLRICNPRFHHLVGRQHRFVASGVDPDLLVVGPAQADRSGDIGEVTVEAASQVHKDQVAAPDLPIGGEAV